MIDRENRKYYRLLPNNHHWHGPIGHYYFWLNVLIPVLYVASIFLEEYLNARFILTGALGLFYLLLLTPYNLTKILNLNLRTVSENVLAGLTLFFFFYGPAFFILNKLNYLKISQWPIVSLNLAFAMLALSLAIKRNLLPTWSWPVRTKPLDQFRRHWPLLVGLVGFFLLHGLFFWFYRFIPEWDSYGYLTQIEDTLASGYIQGNYRGFFTASLALLGTVSGIPPYYLFSVGMIGLQAIIVVTIYLFMERLNLKSNLLKLTVVLSALAIPVLNMEIDTFRPQNILFIFLPIYFFFLIAALETKQATYWVLSSLIVLFGLNYHEFFGFIFLVHLAVGFGLTFRIFYREARDNKDRLIFYLGLSTAGLLVYLFITRISLFGLVITIMNQASDQVTNTTNWRLWFIDNYNTDGAALSVGWAGWFGALKYYGYYLSPAVGMFTLWFIWRLSQPRPFSSRRLILIFLPLVGLLLAIAEILPRLGVVYLPERFWVIIGLTVLIISTYLLQSIEQSTNPTVRKLFIGSMIAAIILGIAGSVYVAQAKHALTTDGEYLAVQWIKQNTAQNAVFITQAANGPMIKYFAKRQLYVPEEQFFLADEVVDSGINFQRDKLRAVIEEQRRMIREGLASPRASNTVGFQEFTRSLMQAQEIIDQTTVPLELITAYADSPQYILYSLDKFNSLYNERRWWRQANFYGADYHKFSSAYPLIYQQKGVYIWKVKDFSQL